MTALLLFIAATNFNVATSETYRRFLAAKGFVYLVDVAPDIEQDVRYATQDNFTGQIVPGYQAKTCILRLEAAQALARAQKSFEEQGLSLKVFDCYRPRRSVLALVRWAQDLGLPGKKSRFYPRLHKTEILSGGYLSRRSAHSRGGTVDVTLVNKKKGHVTGRALRGPGEAPHTTSESSRELDMGTAFDCLDPKAHTRAPGVTFVARRNRRRLLKTLGVQGFVNYPKEWWHFTWRKTPVEPSYFCFDVR